jgi:hypothetical protein
MGNFHFFSSLTQDKIVPFSSNFGGLHATLWVIIVCVMGMVDYSILLP